jgi:hypothetical protein
VVLGASNDRASRNGGAEIGASSSPFLRHGLAPEELFAPALSLLSASCSFAFSRSFEIIVAISPEHWTIS